MSPLDFALGALAVWRVASLLTEEHGPAGVFLRLRKRAGVLYDESDNKLGYNAASILAGILDCLWCCSVWVAGALALLHLAAPRVARAVTLPLALSAGAIIVQEALDRGRQK